MPPRHLIGRVPQAEVQNGVQTALLVVVEGYPGILFSSLPPSLPHPPEVSNSSSGCYTYRDTLESSL